MSKRKSDEKEQETPTEPSATQKQADPSRSASVMERELDTHIRARYPVIQVVTNEEDRLLRVLMKLSQARKRPLRVWSATRGLCEIALGQDAITFQPVDQELKDPLPFLEMVERVRKGPANEEHTTFVALDLHPYLREPVITRKLRDVIGAIPVKWHNLVMVSPVNALPPDIEKEVVVLDFQLPTRVEIEEQLRLMQQGASGNKAMQTDLTPEQAGVIARACQGLTIAEVSNVLSKSLCAERCFDVGVVNAEKKQLIRRNEVLEWWDAAEVSLTDDVGGLENLKGWVRKRAGAYSDRARAFGLPWPKGILLAGHPGCGKSLSAKALAGLLQLPLIRLDAGKIFASHIGESEGNVRSALKTIDAAAPAVVWVDEVEKGFAGTGTALDSGVSQRVVATLLTWMQESKAAVFKVFTANDVHALPAPLLRAGRFDKIFYVDFPNAQEREAILSIHLRKRGRDPAKFSVRSLAGQAPDYSGAELEAAVVEALFTAFDAGREVTDDDIAYALENLTPIAKSMPDQIAAVRKWAEGRATPASVPEVGDGDGVRRVQVFEGDEERSP